ncbi:hypothetical protein SAMD00019534_071070 [Acytostelium subglobosum LB1]|uniref:hypothetical protein n=1 Tax=Acytostelium subglobosum LB1 TaxID=1410327 RepID=UPI000644C91D|nr:hypothetical protein SAMD00019534_071070 [Acytostelium subglobosum LB1]GAM23932.1 hypothetical protein SAMD00019534_071070 [Acytostelium subglobosum LB1]|eukprot:XP_012752968.1 hypothetical protein SAMD00019534_071070 [Acytostelium subglobosum LB1]
MSSNLQSPSSPQQGPSTSSTPLTPLPLTSTSQTGTPSAGSNPIPVNFQQQQSPVAPATPTQHVQPQQQQSMSFMDILNAWKQFNIEKKKSELDAFVAQIATIKEDCVQSRKVLAKQTQDFKKVVDEEKIKTFGALLKLYQEEVDKLTKRSKFSETCFFGIYKDLMEAADPVPALNAALDEYAKVDSTAKLEIENKKLQLELSEFRKEFQEIQNQEVTIRRLEDKIKDYESSFQSNTAEIIANREQELRQEYKTKMLVLKERNQELDRQVGQLQEELNKITRTHDQNQTQIFDIKVMHDDEMSSKQSEIDMLTNEMERISTKLSTLQTENSSLREESMKEKNAIQPLAKRIAELELELLQRESEMSKMNDTLNESKQTLKEEMAAYQDTFSQLEIERQKILNLEKLIQNNPSPADYENVKRELATLQAIVGSEEVVSSNQQNDKPMKEKNRQLENDLTKLRLTIGTYESELDESRRQVEQLESIQVEQSALILRLEEDLAVRGGGGNSGNVNLRSSQSGPTNDLASLIQSSPISSLSHSTNSGITQITPQASSGDLTGVQSKDDKMLDIVIGQRDRFKTKNLQLENEKAQLEKQLETCKLEVHSLKQDNIKLYEKIRFLQSYDKNRGGGVITGNAKRAGDRNYDMERGGTTASTSNNDTEEKYGKLYEDSINPFLSFNKKEKYRRYKEMNTAERVILNTSRFFLSTKYSRLFLFIYSVLLHLLVFVTLYKLAVTTAEQHDPDFQMGGGPPDIAHMLENKTNNNH